MPASFDQHLTHERLDSGVHIIRFVRPDLRRQLDPGVGEDNPLYREMIECLEDLSSGGRVIFNFGIVERFPTAFFQLMMRVRQYLLSRNAQVWLCCFRPEILPTVELMGGSRLFNIANSEDSALHETRIR